MTTVADERKRQRVEEVVALLAERLGGGIGGPETAAATAFLRRYYDSVAADDVLAASRDDLLAAALSLWRLGAERRPGAPEVRVFNPTVAGDGWKCAHTVAELVNDDMPFLVTSVTGALNRRDRTIHLVAHPVVAVERDETGRRLGLAADAGGGSAPPAGLAESYIHVEFDQETSSEALAEIAAELEQVLADVRASVSDWPAMRAQVEVVVADLERHPPPVTREELEEAIAFLRWLASDHFVFVGYREYDLVERGRRRLPALRPRLAASASCARRQAGDRRAGEEAAAPGGCRPRPPARRRSSSPRPMTAPPSTARSISTTSACAVSTAAAGWWASGVSSGCSPPGSTTTACGTSRCCAARSKRCSPRAGFAPDSHDARALVHILETLPRDELFQIAEESCTTSPWASSTCRSASAWPCSCAATPSTASSPAWSTSPAIATRRSCAGG